MNALSLMPLLFCALLVVALLTLPSLRPRGRDGTAVNRRAGAPFRDDRYWYGFFYCNPDDPALFVPRRYGYGWAVNVGNPLGRAFVIAVLAVVIFGGIVLPALTHSAGCHPSGCHIGP